MNMNLFNFLVRLAILGLGVLLIELRILPKLLQFVIFSSYAAKDLFTLTLYPILAWVTGNILYWLPFVISTGAYLASGFLILFFGIWLYGRFFDKAAAQFCSSSFEFALMQLLQYVPAPFVYAAARISMNCVFMVTIGSPVPELEECKEVLDLVCGSDACLNDPVNWGAYTALRTKHMQDAFFVPKENGALLDYINNNVIPSKYREYVKVEGFTRKTLDSPAQLSVEFDMEIVSKFLQNTKFGYEPKCLPPDTLPDPLAGGAKHPMIYKTPVLNKQIYLGAVCTSSKELQWYTDPYYLNQKVRGSTVNNGITATLEGVYSQTQTIEITEESNIMGTKKKSQYMAHNLWLLKSEHMSPWPYPSSSSYVQHMYSQYITNNEKKIDGLFRDQLLRDLDYNKNNRVFINTLIDLKKSPSLFASEHFPKIFKK